MNHKLCFSFLIKISSRLSFSFIFRRRVNCTNKYWKFIHYIFFLSKVDYNVRYELKQMSFSKIFFFSFFFFVQYLILRPFFVRMGFLNRKSHDIFVVNIFVTPLNGCVYLKIFVIVITVWGKMISEYSTVFNIRKNYQTLELNIKLCFLYEKKKLNVSCCFNKTLVSNSRIWKKNHQGHTKNNNNTNLLFG